MFNLSKKDTEDCNHKFIVIDVVETQDYNMHKWIIKCKKCKCKREVNWQMKTDLEREGLIRKRG